MEHKSKYDFSYNPDPQETPDLDSRFRGELGEAVDIALDIMLSNPEVVRAIDDGKITKESLTEQLYEKISEIFNEEPSAWAGEDQDDDNSWFTWFDADRLAEVAAEYVLENLPLGESFMKEEIEIKKTKGSATAKVRKLQKQYNKILVDLFDQFAAESIEEALEGNEGSFGENINDIVQNALDNLKTKVLDELGVKSGVVGEIGIAIGGGDMADFMGGAEEEASGEEENETEAHEEEESDAFEAGEQAAGDEDEVKEAYKPHNKNVSKIQRPPPEFKVGEMVYVDYSAPEEDIDTSDMDREYATPIVKITWDDYTNSWSYWLSEDEENPEELTEYDAAAIRSFEESYKPYNKKASHGNKMESVEGIKREQIISESRRSDQMSLTDIYTTMYKK